MKYYTLSLRFLILILFFSLAACAPNLAANSYSSDQVGVANNTVSGVIISKRIVKINKNTGAGGLLGVAGGAVAGSAIGGGTRANILGGIGGALVGGLAGNAIEKGISSSEGFEYIIRLNKGKTISVTQTADNNLAVGEHVRVIYGNPVRVISAG